MSEKVTYHQEGGRDREYVILSKNADGTIDIGPEGGPAVVTGAKIAESRTVGMVTLSEVEAEESDADESGSGKKKPTK